MINYSKAFAILSLMLLIALSSCKDPVSPMANVTVRNGMQNINIENNTLLQGAIVTVYINPNTGQPGYVDPDNKVETVVKYTDGSGKCSFDFTVENILQVRAEYPLGTDTLYGEGILVLKEDKTEEEVIYLRKFKSQL